MKQNLSSSDKIKIVVVSIIVAILLVILGFMVGLLLRQKGFRLSMLVPASQATSDSVSTSIDPTVIVPTADCGSPTLLLGTTTFQIQNLTAGPDGSLTVPPDASGIAYWVEGTDHNYVFVLSPTTENLLMMSTMTAGNTATATWSNCNSTTYSLSAPQPTSLNVSTLPDQSVDGITVFFQTDSSGAGFVFKGELAEQVISVIDTPMPDESGILAEISLLETTASLDGRTISVSLSILNYGQTPFTILSNDLSLTQPDGMSLDLESSKPRLPEKISPGETEIIELIFPRPSSPIATLKIFTIEYDIEGY